MADHASSTPTPIVLTAYEDFHQALSQAHIIADIISHLADVAISTQAQPCGSLYEWLVNELNSRLERVEIVADATMWAARI